MRQKQGQSVFQLRSINNERDNTLATSARGGEWAWPDNSSDDSSTATQIQTNQRLNGSVCTQREIIDFNLTLLFHILKSKQFCNDSVVC